MNLGLKAQANFFFSQAEYVETRTGGEDLASEYYLTAKTLYSEVLSSYPSDSEAQLNLAVTLTKMLNIKYKEQPFPSDDGGVEDVNQKFIKAIAISKDEKGVPPANAYFFYAKFLSRCRELGKAEANFLKAIKATPFCARYMLDYAVFLKREREMKKLSFVMLLRAKLISEALKQSLELLEKGDSAASILMRCDSVVQGVTIELQENEYYCLAENFDIAYGRCEQEKLQQQLLAWETADKEEELSRVQKEKENKEKEERGIRKRFGRNKSKQISSNKIRRHQKKS